MEKTWFYLIVFIAYARTAFAQRGIRTTTEIDSLRGGPDTFGICPRGSPLTQGGVPIRCRRSGFSLQLRASPEMFRCPDGFDCISRYSGSQRGVCCRRRVRRERPGRCPAPRIRFLGCPRGRVFDECYVDSECPRPQKCCRTRCARRCTYPLFFGGGRGRDGGGRGRGGGGRGRDGGGRGRDGRGRRLRDFSSAI